MTQCRDAVRQALLLGSHGNAVLAADHLAAVADPNASLQLALLHPRLEAQQDEADGEALWGGQTSDSKESTSGS